MTDLPRAEFEARLERASALMRARGLDALLLCSEPEIRWFTGFRTPFWQSPARNWFAVVRPGQAPVAIIPTIGAELMGRAFTSRIMTYPAPAADDPSPRLIADCLSGCDCIGLPMGAESSLPLPLSLFEEIRAAVGGCLVDATALIQDLRMVKSAAEIALIARACAAAGRAFDRAGELFHPGQPLSAAFRAFRIALLQEGVDEVPYLVGGAGPGGYGDVISPPSDRPLQEGDVLMLDTGATVAGYFCDFDRNFAIARADDGARAAHAALWQATEAALAALRPGMKAAELFGIMHAALGGGSSDVGRFGHGLGMTLTEWPSLAAHDPTVLRAGMVLTLEPSVQIAPGRMMVHEENLHLTPDGPVLLTPRTPPDLPVIGG